MISPCLHFNGECRKVIELYEKAFKTKVIEDSIDYMDDGRKIAHAAMCIHGTQISLNDALEFLSNTFENINGMAHLAVTFNTTDELLACYEVLKTDNDVNPFVETPYSELVGNFPDKFGVLWGFMVISP